MDDGYIASSFSTPNSTSIASHGFNSSFDSMHPFFIATGPAFTCGFTDKIFHNTDIYSLICHVLDLVPYDNDGSVDNVQHILNAGQGKCSSTLCDVLEGCSRHTTSWIITTAVCAALLLLLLGVVVGTIVYFYKSSQPDGYSYRYTQLQTKEMEYEDER